MTICKKDDWLQSHQKSGFFIASKGVGLSLTFDLQEKPY